MLWEGRRCVSVRFGGDGWGKEGGLCEAKEGGGGRAGILVVFEGC